MRETHYCPDGREVVLKFNEEALRVEAISPEGLTVGSYQFALVGPDGEAIDVTHRTGGAVSFKLAQTNLADAWHHQGITERVMDLVAQELTTSPVVELPKE